ncbi:MAG: type II secretion system protein GspJ [Verrucomicrobiota bacterium]
MNVEINKSGSLMRCKVDALQRSSTCGVVAGGPGGRDAARYGGQGCLPPQIARGFTLIEMILAIGIAAIVIIVVNAAFYSALRLRDDTSDMVDAASPVDAAVTFMKRDLECAVTPTNGTSKVLSGGFRVGTGLTSLGVSDPVAIEMFTATGALSESAPWGDIQRVTYELRTPADASAAGRDLYRSVLRNLLAIGTPEVTDQLMLNGVASLKFSCYDGMQWDDTWDTTDPTAIYTNLPTAVRVDIKMAGRSDMAPIEIVVPIDSQSRTNMVLTTTTGS